MPRRVVCFLVAFASIAGATGCAGQERQAPASASATSAAHPDVVVIPDRDDAVPHGPGVPRRAWRNCAEDLRFDGSRGPYTYHGVAVAGATSCTVANATFVALARHVIAREAALRRADSAEDCWPGYCGGDRPDLGGFRCNDDEANYSDVSPEYYILCRRGQVILAAFNEDDS